MSSAEAKLQDEAGRLAALRRYEVLDTPREPAFDRITALVKRVLKVPICNVSLIDADRQWFKSCVGLSVSETRRDESFCTHTIMEREPLCVPDAKLDTRFLANPLVTGDPFIRSYLGFPLSTPDGYNVGSLCVIDVVPRSYSPNEIEILKSFATLAGNELELRRIAETDHLTGAVTRRGFTLEMEKILSRYRRWGRPAALLLLDLDDFKRVNDVYGHPTGDLVLQTVSRELVSQLRHGDILGRLGGEEFGILLQETSIIQSVETAERLRLHLQSVPVQHDPSIRITASFGIAPLDSQTASVQHWLAAADKAMYDAKQAGRNRSHCAGV
ncbi:diguanylate cyclase/phosphodiesterase (GGDEF & EAL domains) with PAS/PAC sensor(s) (plasmid) [Acidisarcina polymorpha]|uniref:Diguanylate cyclase/phosphodiesterase (GGDEF & EAL domains) with PAS/PAC sensor(S) n=1 Tax=Acidisarcina polymorpha TaxID=2211140 RepID=A0A2Z5GB57_9BACT|nr:sensor domain-containing diguanylate cyclase [Acidisarcina polymorpha]AXC16160.1 diguanylate cyclase/phosphodiesterase (GGDEF & EAL domains) with PAS/PAC sensor(s) [Acidisarcina polymorpha]